MHYTIMVTAGWVSDLPFDSVVNYNAAGTPSNIYINKKAAAPKVTTFSDGFQFVFLRRFTNKWSISNIKLQQAKSSWNLTADADVTKWRHTAGLNTAGVL